MSQVLLHGKPHPVSFLVPQLLNSARFHNRRDYIHDDVTQADTIETCRYCYKTSYWSTTVTPSVVILTNNTAYRSLETHCWSLAARTHLPAVIQCSFHCSNCLPADLLPLYWHAWAHLRRICFMPASLAGDQLQFF